MIIFMGRSKELYEQQGPLPCPHSEWPGWHLTTVLHSSNIGPNPWQPATNSLLEQPRFLVHDSGSRLEGSSSQPPLPEVLLALWALFVRQYLMGKCQRKLVTEALWSTSLLARVLWPGPHAAWPGRFSLVPQSPNPEVLGHSSTKYHGCDGDRQNTSALYSWA